MNYTRCFVNLCTAVEYFAGARINRANHLNIHTDIIQKTDLEMTITVFELCFADF